ncbi:MAG: DUF5114 domain-containing protein [Candidatus Symbiothrix sp.]|jgi:hypothetical protein|nr:DUF5114 domain-containing protein [Candidatus Symbiothrix sp.]
MKTKIINNCLWTLLLLLAISACEEDGERLYLSGLEENELAATKENVVLSQETSQEIVLSLAWNNSTLSVSNPDKKAPNVLSTYVQVSNQSDFATNVIEILEKSPSKAYTGAELNTIAKNLQLTPDIASPVYFRIRSSVGNNMEPVYSNVVTVNITPYSIDMSIGFILSKEQEDTGRTLSSPQSDGIYTGFMGVVGYQNFFLQEGDGTIWGNVPVDGSAFLISSADPWNFWFPGTAGCYYVNINTAAKEWSALLLPVLTVSGDLSGDMIFDRPNVKWTYAINATAASTLKIKLNSAGQLYNAQTGTDASVSQALAFTQEGNRLVLASSAGDITVNVPAAGEYTLVIDLSNPNEWTYEVVSGSAGPIEVNPCVYLPGIDDGITGGDWNFDNKLPLFDEDKLTYAGVVNVNSLWGYTINTEKDNWADKYTLGEGDAYSGTLVFQGTNGDLPAPAAGLYLIETSLKELTYNLTSVGNEIYVVGLHDVWDFNTPLAATVTPGVFSGSITINSASPWGFTINLKDSWTYKFGGSEGKLYYQGSNITDDASLAPGAYQMTVDLVNLTYKFE